MSLMAAPAVDPGSLVAGDLVFFRIDGRRVSHVGIYVGEGRFVHAPSRGGKVRVDRLDDRYWSRRYAGARRVLERG
jgi:cell wall-associated NlpC family hydrolase